jgi:hypothetical protein
MGGSHAVSSTSPRIYGESQYPRWGEGPGPIFAKVVERFRPQAFYGNPTRREIYMVVNLDTPAQIAELMYVLTWFTGGEPTFTPIMGPEIYGEAIANAKKIVAPPK